MSDHRPLPRKTTVVLSDHTIRENHINSCIHCKKKDDAILNCTKKNIIQLQYANNNKQQYYYKEVQPPPQQQQQQQQSNTTKEPLICEYCNIANHSIENCKKYICKRCDQRGHHENRCKVNTSLYCEYCDKKGHETQKCKRKPTNAIVDDDDIVVIVEENTKQ